MTWEPALRLVPVPRGAVASTHLHGKVCGDAADLDTNGCSVTVPHVLLGLLEVAGCYPALVVALLFIPLFLRTGLILRTLLLLSGLCADGGGRSFLGWRSQVRYSSCCAPGREQGSKDSGDRRLQVPPAAPAAPPRCWAAALASTGRS